MHDSCGNEAFVEIAGLPTSRQMVRVWLREKCNSQKNAKTASCIIICHNEVQIRRVEDFDLYIGLDRLRVAQAHTA